MDDCKMCGKPVPDEDAVQVAAAEETGVFHAVCWDDYEAIGQGDLDFASRWGLVLKPGTP
jgi:hypothetical protein